MKSETHIQNWIEQTRQIMNKAENLREYDLRILSRKPEPNSWSILECLEHLNLYGDYYLPEIDRKINTSLSKSEMEFRSGLLGNYFAKSMLPLPTMKKMKTFKDKDPRNAELDKTAIDRFMGQQIRLLDLINQSGEVSLNKVRISTSISKLIRIKLGDAFQFIINHNLRHFKQIDRIMGHI
jgi:hypothetical protein